MSTETIQRAYNDVVASHYDLDPQGVTGRAQDRAIERLRRQFHFGEGAGPIRTLDLGMGTGLFLSKLQELSGNLVEPFGLDLAPNMLEYAHRRIKNLVAECDDAANLDDHFPGQIFDCVSTHFITGFVPMTVLAPKIWRRLEEGGYWSLVGGIKSAYPVLRSKVDRKIIRWAFGVGTKTVDDVICNPADCQEVVQTMEKSGFEVCEAETFEPTLAFHSFDQFMEYGYTGGWLTPLLDAIGLQKSGPMARWFLNRFFFPFDDKHRIAIVLARKVIK